MTANGTFTATVGIRMTANGTITATWVPPTAPMGAANSTITGYAREQGQEHPPPTPPTSASGDSEVGIVGWGGGGGRPRTGGSRSARHRNGTITTRGSCSSSPKRDAAVTETGLKSHRNGTRASPKRDDYGVRKRTGTGTPSPKPLLRAVGRSLGATAGPTNGESRPRMRGGRVRSSAGRCAAAHRVAEERRIGDGLHTGVMRVVRRLRASCRELNVPEAACCLPPATKVPNSALIVFLWRARSLSVSASRRGARHADALQPASASV
jgi:hypothetical protein